MTGDSRRSDRHRVRFKLVYDDGEGYHAGLVRDLSETGVFLETRETLPIGTEVSVSSLEVDAEHGFDLPARVVRVVEFDADNGSETFGMGLEFEELTSEQSAFILGLITRLEAEEAKFEGEPDAYFGKTLPREGLRRAPSGVWRPPPVSPAGVAGAREPSASPQPSATAEGEDSDGEPEPARAPPHPVELSILEPVEDLDLRFESPVSAKELAHPATWPRAPWRARRRLPFPSSAAIEGLDLAQDLRPEASSERDLDLGSGSGPNDPPSPRLDRATDAGSSAPEARSVPVRELDDGPDTLNVERRLLLRRRGGDLVSRIDRVVGEQGQPLDDVVVVDESLVSSLLAEVEPAPSGPRGGVTPLDRPPRGSPDSTAELSHDLYLDEPPLDDDPA